jgi:hypothetical protein
MTAHAYWVYTRQGENSKAMSGKEYDTEGRNQWFSKFEQGNSLLWMASDWESECVGLRCWSCWWGTISIKLDESWIVSNRSSKWVSISFYEVS